MVDQVKQDFSDTIRVPIPSTEFILNLSNWLRMTMFRFSDFFPFFPDLFI